MSEELKDMLIKEDELSAELTISRVTSLQQIISNLPPSLGRFVLEQLIAGLQNLIYMELGGANVFALRSNGGPFCFSKYPPKLKILKVRPLPLMPPHAIVYKSWLIPPELQKTSPPAQLMDACYNDAE